MQAHLLAYSLGKAKLQDVSPPMRIAAQKSWQTADAGEALLLAPTCWMCLSGMSISYSNTSCEGELLSSTFMGGMSH